MANIFFGDLRIPASEQVGPKLNSRTVALLHPDMYVTSPDAGRARVKQRQVDRSTWLPDKDLTNIIVKSVNETLPDGTVAVKTHIYEEQKVGPGEPLAPVSPRLNEDIVFEELNNVKEKYLEDNYAQIMDYAIADGEKPLLQLLP